jgi:hypothetical protein
VNSTKNAGLRKEIPVDTAAENPCGFLSAAWVIFRYSVRRSENPCCMQDYFFTALHRTVIRLPPPAVQVYSDKSNPLVIISLAAFPGSVSRRTTS